MTQEILSHTCPFCGNLLSRKFKQVRENDSNKYSVFFCEQCAIGVTLPAPSAAELDRLYGSESYRTASGVRFSKLIERLIFLFRLGRRRRVEHFIRKGRILDIGCGRGLFLALMRTGGWDVAGTEFNAETASYAAKAYGLEVKGGVPSEWGFPDTSFDVITIHHALEHVPDPEEMIGACTRLLKNEGLLVIAVPNLSSLQAAAGKGAWFHLDVPYHLYHFSEEGLAKLLRKHSFAVARTRRFDLEQGPFGWLQTLLNRSGIRRNFLYDLLKNPVLRNREKAGNIKTDVLYTFLLLPLYIPLSFMLSLVESFLLKRGGTVEMYAVKNDQRSAE
jgi:2-polyprenyl-3-methyl-5-hydroxy-6-metoxy-1,4-benzoquinol methylase